jgi:hypothetical protein
MLDARGAELEHMNASTVSIVRSSTQLFLAACLVATSSKSPSTELVANPLDKKLSTYVDRYNEKLPAMVAPTLRQERISALNGVMTYSYTDVSRTGKQLTTLNLKITQRPYIFPAICKAPDTGRMLRDGVSFRYLYYGKDRQLAAQLVFMAADCAGVR